MPQRFGSSAVEGLRSGSDPMSLAGAIHHQGSLSALHHAFSTSLGKLVSLWRLRVPAPTNTSHCEDAEALSETSRAFSLPETLRSNFPSPSSGWKSRRSIRLRILWGRRFTRRAFEAPTPRDVDVGRIDLADVRNVFAAGAEDIQRARRPGS